MKINKKFYHGTSIENALKILSDGELKQMGGSCATDDFHYAKGYALLNSKIGVVLIFRKETKMDLRDWVKYWINRNVIRKLIGKNEMLSDWYSENFNCWGFSENAMEIYVSTTKLYEIENFIIVSKED